MKQSQCKQDGHKGVLCWRVDVRDEGIFEVEKE